MNPSVAAAITMLAISLPLAAVEMTTRLVIMRMPNSETTAVRAALNDAGANPETMDAVLKRPGVGELASFQETEPWRHEVGFLSKEIGGITLEGELRKSLGVQLGLVDSDAGLGVDETLSTDITWQTTPNGYREFENRGNCMIATLGRWQERAFWSDAKDSHMLWQFVTAGDAPDAGLTKGYGSKEAVWVEMRWFKTTMDDAVKLKLSKPETSGKALEWLAGRAKLWRQCGFRVRPGDPASWRSSQALLKLDKGSVVTIRESFYIDGTLTESGDQLKMAWKATLKKIDAEQGTSMDIAATVKPGAWEFSTVEGFPDANVLATRLVKD
ncbi:MAG: hypothetical protein V4819_14995 [Verrucomicrobiota bacterium]